MSFKSFSMFVVASLALTNSHWLATTNATLTFIGDPIPTDGSPSRRASTMVTYCNTRSGGVCGGRCTVYNDGAACLNAPGTQCLFATNNVAFGSHGGCGWTCKRLDECGVRLDGFCYTPGTQSILVGAA
ncbi:hypothetical protein FB451DRAFT_1528447 [Mycena latifolia]|nr:hypothetical protein FB451DRAFT_1537619 [Mycena latifolia]KAJ7487782.1 hypothetical protein FB451DRAFT_1528447 [Mycena latifolia]